MAGGKENTNKEERVSGLSGKTHPGEGKVERKACLGNLSRETTPNGMQKERLLQTKNGCP
jgi:hypothetical protein